MATTTEDIQFEQVSDASPEILVLKFADAIIPTFKEVRNKDYIKYGNDNVYPEYLAYLFNKSGKHGAIISGKADYIFGKGFENGDFVVNRLGETLNDISKRSILDIEIYGGFRWEVIWNHVRQIAEIYHVDFTTLRLGKDGECFYYKENWDFKVDRTQPEIIPAFNPNEPTGSQIYAYNEYRPMTRFYPLPSYIASNNYIETDIEISKFYLSSIRNGMNPSKMIQFFKGDPTEEKKRQIESSIKKKFTGSENSGKFILVFNDANSVNQTVKVDDLSGSDLDKMFVELNKTVQQEIFSGHRVTSPMLFGIKTEGQLGGTTELATAYSIFQNTYSKPKAENFSKEVNIVMALTSKAGKYELMPSDPLGVQFDVKDVVNSLPREFVFEKLGIPKEMWNSESIGGDSPVAPKNAPGAVQTPAEAVMANDNIKNLTAKQHQQLMRIIRQYSRGQLTELAAKALLRTGLGLSDDDINSLLGIAPAKMSFEDEGDQIIGMFDACGDSKEDYEILKSKTVHFDSDLEMEEDEEVWKQEAFKTYDVTITEDRILELIKKDKRVTPQVIAKVIGETESFVVSKLKSLTKKGYLEESTTMDGADPVIERSIPESVDISAPPPREGSISPTRISVRYSYEVKPGVGAPIIATTRPFCKKMIELNRLYTRAEIESISTRLGYSVFDRRGGFWGRKPECRHRWQSHIVIQKKGGAK